MDHSNMAMFDSERWAAVPFHFWSFVFFVFGSMVGSFLNVCIYRLPLEQSIVSPGSHCPRCGKAIPPWLNVPLVSWLWLGGKCKFCRAPISSRYFLVELLTGALFLCAWLAFGHRSALQVLAYCVLLSGLIAATFIDFEHFIIPDEITLGGAAVGFLASLIVPQLHDATSTLASLRASFLGIGLGAGIIYSIVRLGKLALGRQKFTLAEPASVYFTETALVFPDMEIPYEEIFYRRSDTVVLHARTVELVDRGYRDVTVRLSQKTLQVGEDTFPTEEVPCLEAVTDLVVVPREVMGLGDVKFMAAIGAFLGCAGVVFSLMASAMLGAAVGITLIACGKRAWASRIQYGPYIALAAAIWIFAHERLLKWLLVQ